MKYLSTFSGIGGFEIALDEAGHECVGYSEIDKHAIQVYSSHFPSNHNYGDITTITAESLPDFDLLTGGFPCQSFSIAGKRRGFEDTRGTLFFYLAEIARVKRPRYIFFENVKGLLSHDEGNTFATILSTLDELGYDCQWQVLNSKNFGVPQSRERVFIVGHLRETPRPKVFPFTEQSEVPECGSTLTTRYPASWREGVYIIEDGEQWRDLTPIECERLQGFPDNWTCCLSDAQRYVCLGNAVTVNVIHAIVRRIT